MRAIDTKWHSASPGYSVEQVQHNLASPQDKEPELLSDITEVPIPLDPVTGKPFNYRLNEGTAMLRGPKLRNQTLHYEITMSTASQD